LTRFVTPAGRRRPIEYAANGDRGGRHQDRVVIAAALKDHYLNPKTFPEAQPDQHNEEEEAS
jgi:hypothetical protein